MASGDGNDEEPPPALGLIPMEAHPFGDIEFSVQTGQSMASKEITGMDTTMFVLPQSMMLEGVIVMNWVGQLARAIAEKQAGDLGEVLHHADFIVTVDPSVVQARGIMHDCDACRDALRKAHRILRETPDWPLVIGSLFWGES